MGSFQELGRRESRCLTRRWDARAVCWRSMSSSLRCLFEPACTPQLWASAAKTKPSARKTTLHASNGSVEFPHMLVRLANGLALAITWALSGKSNWKHLLLLIL